jgi:hypothetical protein
MWMAKEKSTRKDNTNVTKFHSTAQNVQKPDKKLNMSLQHSSHLCILYNLKNLVPFGICYYELL